MVTSPVLEPSQSPDSEDVCVKDTTIPRIIQRFYSESGQLTGVSILVEERELRTTVGQFLQWQRDQDPSKARSQIFRLQSLSENP